MRFAQLAGLACSRPVTADDGYKIAYYAPQPRAVIEVAEDRSGREFKLLYPDEMPLRDKIETIAKQMYGARGVSFTSAAAARLDHPSIVRVYDFGKDPLQFCESRLGLVRELRSKIVGELVEDGEGWGKARQAFEALLGQHVTALSIAAGWVIAVWRSSLSACASSSSSVLSTKTNSLSGFPSSGVITASASA